MSTDGFVELGLSPAVHQSVQQPSPSIAALVVEAVADLVADHRADAAVVDGRVGVRVEERRLQDGGGKNDLVEVRVVIGVDGLRRHAPLAAVYVVPVEAAALTVPIEHHAALHIADEIVAGYARARSSRASGRDSRSWCRSCPVSPRRPRGWAGTSSWTHRRTGPDRRPSGC